MVVPVRIRLEEASPIKIAEPPRARRAYPVPALTLELIEALQKTKILLEVEVGVIVAVKPVTVVKDWLVVEKEASVFVADTTCNTLPAGAAGASFTQFVPLYVNNWLSTGEVILTPERLVNAKESRAVSLASITSAVAFQIVGNVLGSEPLAGVVPPESLVTAINQSIRNIR
jgi:hypothetical protein